MSLSLNYYNLTLCSKYEEGAILWLSRNSTQILNILRIKMLAVEIYYIRFFWNLQITCKEIMHQNNGLASS